MERGGAVQASAVARRRRAKERMGRREKWRGEESQGSPGLRGKLLPLIGYVFPYKQPFLPGIKLHGVILLCAIGRL